MDSLVTPVYSYTVDSINIDTQFFFFSTFRFPQFTNLICQVQVGGSGVSIQGEKNPFTELEKFGIIGV